MACGGCAARRAWLKQRVLPRLGKVPPPPPPAVKAPPPKVAKG
jgi:hypothetical protein